MIKFSRNSRSLISKWWWTVDKVLLSLVTVLIIFGIFLNFSASPSVANRIGANTFHFIKRQLVFIPIAYGLMVLISMQNLKTIRRLSIIGFVVVICLMIATLFCGEATKGASRWIRIMGISLQPSEFIKPLFAVVAAWLFEGQKRHNDFPGDVLSFGLYCLTICLLALQPDVGMSIVVTAIWGFQLFLSGLSLTFVGRRRIRTTFVLNNCRYLRGHRYSRHEPISQRQQPVHHTLGCRLIGLIRITSNYKHGLNPAPHAH